MASNSFFDTTRSETSEASSMEGHTESQKCETSAPEHTRLAELKKLARVDAEHQQKVVEVRKLKKTKDKRGRITKSKRQTSNIKSAEICRAAKGFYIERLEREILLGEEVYLQMMKDILDQCAETVRLRQRIAYLEEQYNAREAQKSWTAMWQVEAAVSEDVVDDIFRVPGDNYAPVQWDYQSDGCASAWDVDIEVYDTDGGKWMYFNEVNAPKTPPPPVEVDVPVTPKKEKHCAIGYDAEKILRSPVSIFCLEGALEKGSLSLKS